MPMLVKKTCPNSRTTLEGWTTDYRIFGSPLVRCTNCLTVLLRDNVNEWQAMIGWQSLEFIGALMMTIIAEGLGIPLLIIAFSTLAFGGGHYFFKQMIVPTGEILQNLTALTCTMIVSGLIFALAWEVRSFLRGIKRSNDRLRDSAYRDLLKFHGILRD
jgi:hypothetical protein